MFDYDLEDRYEHVYAPEEEVGVHEVLVEDHDRCLAITVVFYDTRTVNEDNGMADGHVQSKWMLAQNRVAALDPILKDEEDATDDISNVKEFHGFWRYRIVTADTPAVRGIIAELKDFERWAEKSITAKACYLGTVIGSLDILWD